MKTLIFDFLITILVSISFLGHSASAFAQSNILTRDFSTFSWSAIAPNRVSNEKWDHSEVAAFLDRLIDNSSVSSKIGDFVFTDVDADGELELLATVDYSGRGFFNTLFIVHRNSDSFSTQTIPVWNMASLEGKTRDLDHDGQMELILAQRLTPYLGASHPVAAWIAVYTLVKSEYMERSAEFSLFYQTEIIPRLKQDPTVLGTRANHDDDVSEIQLARIDRVVNLNPTAGLELALGWSKDPKPIRRVFAASVLGDINDKSAEEALQKLSLDPDPDVATNARSVLSRKRKP